MLLAKYAPGAISLFNPRMMLKVIIYAYTQKIFSSRRMVTALKNIYFMWLSRMNTLDFRTINNFRCKRMRYAIEKVLGQMIVMLAEQWYINLEDYLVDGTKIEANANKYTWYGKDL